MPNYIQNILSFEGDDEQIKRLLETIKGDSTVFDFNQVIPMPKELNIESSSKQSISFAVYVYQNFGKIDQTLENMHKYHCNKHEKLLLDDYIKLLINQQSVDLSLGKQAYENLQKYGYKDWYYWCIHNHGTKWNAVESCVEGNVLQFQTAWSPPIPVIEKLAELFPNLTIHHIWADEDMGVNCGETFYYANDGKVDTYIESFSQQAYAIYVECWGETDCIYKNKNGNYIRRSCSECKLCG